MSDAAVPAGKKKAAAAKKSSITVTFTDADAQLYESIQKAALVDDRSDSKFLLLYLRKNFTIQA